MVLEFTTAMARATTQMIQGAKSVTTGVRNLKSAELQIELANIRFSQDAVSDLLQLVEHNGKNIAEYLENHGEIVAQIKKTLKEAQEAAAQSAFNLTILS